ncbi:Upstream activation factor subunit spp27 [Porphyridium purpureum]|uniref:Upstream activation factor subunit spp27 n=1 Tax=Porphyridium purpureum TaxID=35688 RepID=A0A5J4YWX2_PORPP|nr:Upstream activation factor subunit spp27 [Porphyridium purpureum]|eukprot:POR9557..scf227_4
MAADARARARAAVGDARKKSARQGVKEQERHADGPQSAGWSDDEGVRLEPAELAEDAPWGAAKLSDVTAAAALKESRVRAVKNRASAVSNGRDTSVLPATTISSTAKMRTAASQVAPRLKVAARKRSESPLSADGARGRGLVSTRSRKTAPKAAPRKKTVRKTAAVASKPDTGTRRARQKRRSSAAARPDPLRSRRRTGMTMHYIILNKKLAKQFKDGIAQRTEVCRFFASYAKENGLQSADDAHLFRVDKFLHGYFGAAFPEGTLADFRSIVKAVSPLLQIPRLCGDARLADLAEQRDAEFSVAQLEKAKTKSLETPRKLKGLELPVRLTRACAALLGAQVSSRVEVMQLVWKYIKANELQLADNRTLIRCDAKLKAVTKSDTISMFDLMRVMSQQCSKIDANEAVDVQPATKTKRKTK